MQLNGGPVPVPGPSVPLTGPSVPLMGPSVPLAVALFNSLIVGHNPGFNCIDPKDIGLGWTY